MPAASGGSGRMCQIASLSRTCSTGRQEWQERNPFLIKKRSWLCNMRKLCCVLLFLML
jgi:hypothetical protein